MLLISLQPSLRSTVEQISKDTKAYGRLPKNGSSDCITMSTTNNGPLSTDHTTVSNTKLEGDSIKNLSNHPVSILAGKLDPIRRNSYGYVLLNSENTCIIHIRISPR